MKRLGLIYQYHLRDRLSGKAGHYIGFCEFGNLAERDRIHHRGVRWEHTWGGEVKHTGAAAILAAAVERGIEFELVRCWRGTRDDERALKRQKAGPKFCPICNPRPRQARFLDEISIEAALAEKRKR